MFFLIFVRFLDEMALTAMNASFLGLHTSRSLPPKNSINSTLLAGTGHWICQKISNNIRCFALQMHVVQFLGGT